MTDWYGEISKTEPKEGTNWYGELTGSKFKELSTKAPVTVREPEEIKRLQSAPMTPDEQERLYVVDNPKYAASTGTYLKSGFANSNETLIKTAAKARFPKLPLEEATQRYGVVGGDLVYVGDDGNLYREFPTDDYSPKSMAKEFARAIGPAIPATAGMGVGIATAPMLLTGPAGAATSIGLTGFAQAGGEAVRQGIGKLLIDDPVDAGPVVSEGVQGAAGQMLAGGAASLMNRHAARDVGRMDQRATAALEEKANRFDIPLTPAEKTNLPSLKGQQKALSNLPYSADTMDDYYRARGEKVSVAVGRQLDDISKVEGGEAAGKAGKEGAEKISRGMERARAEKASPLYNKAFESKTPVDVSPVVKYIDNQLITAKGDIKTTLEKARGLLKSPDSDDLDTSVIGLHNSKMALDDMIDGARESGIGNVAKFKLQEVKTKLLKQIDDVSPEYRAARALYADVSPGIEKVREGVVGVLAELQDERLQKAGQILFDPKNIGPRSVSHARALFYGAGQQDSWNTLVRSYLQEQFEMSGREFATAGGISTQGAKFRASMMGNPQQKTILRAAMEPQQFQTFSDLMDVLEATGRVAKVGSDTAWNQEAMKEMRRVSGGITKNILAPHQIPGRIRDWFEQVKLGKYSEKLAETITSPEAMTKLKELRKVSPRSARATVVVADVLGLLTEEGLESLESKETRLPDAYDKK